MTMPPFTPRSTFSFQLEPACREPCLPPGRVPRVVRLLALAIKFESLIGDGTVRDCAELAHLGHVSHAWVRQIMSLLTLDPCIQEEILFLPLTQRGRDPIRMRHMQPITAVVSWKKQRRLWHALRRHAESMRKSP